MFLLQRQENVKYQRDLAANHVTRTGAAAAGLRTAANHVTRTGAAAAGLRTAANHVTRTGAAAAGPRTAPASSARRCVYCRDKTTNTIRRKSQLRSVRSRKPIHVFMEICEALISKVRSGTCKQEG